MNAMPAFDMAELWDVAHVGGRDLTLSASACSASRRSLMSRGDVQTVSSCEGSLMSARRDSSGVTSAQLLYKCCALTGNSVSTHAELRLKSDTLLPSFAELRTRYSDLRL